MDCSEARILIDDLLDRDLDSEHRRALEQHLAECDVCAFSYDEALEVERWAEDLKSAAPSRDFVDRVMARIEAEPPPVAVIGRSPRRLYVELAIAAALAAVVAVPLVFAGGGAVADRIGEIAGSASEFVRSASADVLEEAGAVAVSLENAVGPPEALSPVWLVLAAVMAFAVMIGFNYMQAHPFGVRSSGRKTGGRR